MFTDKLSGSAKTARPGLVALLDYARPGDTVVVAAIDRLGRSVAEVTRTIADLAERRITLYVLREGVDTATPTGRAIAAIMPASPNWGSNWAASAAPHPENPVAPASAGHQTPEAQPRTARTAATACRDRGTGAQLAEAFGIGRATAYRYLAGESPTDSCHGSG